MCFFLQQESLSAAVAGDYALGILKTFETRRSRRAERNFRLAYCNTANGSPRLWAERGFALSFKKLHRRNTQYRFTRIY